MNNNKPLVSIILVCYNHAAFLAECLDSILGQTYTNWELIIADDASADISQELIRRWLQENKVSATLVFHEKNKGLCATLNECIDEAKGAYIKLFSADDIMKSRLIEQSVALFEQDGPELGLVYSNAIIINTQGAEVKTLLDPQNPAPSGWIKEALMEKNFIPALSVMTRKEVYEVIGPFQTDIVTEDYDAWLRTARHFRCTYINEVLSCYRVHDNNISANHDFAADVVRSLMRNDKDGDFAERVKKLMMDRYYLNNMKKEVLDAYNQYVYKDKWLAFSLNNRLPYRFYRCIDKLKS